MSEELSKAVSLLQEKINKRAEKRLDDELAAYFDPIGQCINRADYAHDFEISTDDGTFKMQSHGALKAIREKIKAGLLAKYIKEDTQAFIEEIRTVRHVLEQEP